MSSEEFWKDDPQLFVSYRTSFLNKKKREMEENDYKSWLLGLYIHDGNGKLFMSLKQFLHNMVANIFKCKKDNTSLNTYPQKPYGELAKENQEKISVDNQNKKYEEYQKSFEYYGTMKQRYLENLRRKENK